MTFVIESDEAFAHYGTPRHSGRYPWGSGGDNIADHNKSLLDYVATMRKQGMSETDIAKGLGMTTTQLRAQKTIARNEQKAAQIAMAQRLKDKGYSNVAIGQRMGVPESSVRALLAPGTKDRNDNLLSVANMLKDQVDNKNFVDVGLGVENYVGVTKEKLAAAVAILREQGYELHRLKLDQVGVDGNKTEYKVLCPPGVTQRDVWMNRDKIKQIQDYSDDGGRSFLGLAKPLSIDPRRVGIRYAEDGGAAADGVIYVRPGVKDVELGGSNYAQVRVAVNGTHYLKGMAMYKDDLPAGVDLMFNTNKSDTGNKLDALKPMQKKEDGEVDLDNPFGSAISRQIGKIDPRTGKITEATSAMNIVNEEGDWDKWSKNLSSQMLSKQKPSLAKSQLAMTYEQRLKDLDEINSLQNPAVKKKLLEAYADSTDAAAVHLKAAALPRQRTQVILPIESLGETQIYAPNFRNGEQVALIRYPHGGTFEIPELTVNNNHPEASKLLAGARDAVGISPKVAERLSGADFDGDTVLVIPNNLGKVKSTPALEDLKNFDPKSQYPQYEGMKVMSASEKATQMGVVSNLITDMTIQGANASELARAVKHSMVVIDAEKHKLNYKQSAIDNNISQLKEKYQGSARGGAETLISKAGATVRVNKRELRPAREGGPIDPVTGKKVYKETGESYTDASGAVVPKTQKSKRLAETEDAYSLLSKDGGTVMERLYAEHSNRLKDLANEARREMVATKPVAYNASAKKAYDKEVKELDAALSIAISKKPLERQAQVLANTWVAAKRAQNPNMEKAELKKVKGQALAEARARTGAGKTLIEITESQWAAIQAGAISNYKLTQILENADLTVVKQLATPKTNQAMTSIKQRRAEAMLASGYTQSDVADALGVSLSTLKKYI